MITLKEFLEAIDYRITEGSDYLWKCYGENSYCLDSWNGNVDGPSASIIFDTVTQVVYEVTVIDNVNRRGYRMINPQFRKRHKKECRRRGVNKQEMWEGAEYTDLEVEEDFLEKLVAIIHEKEYSTDICIPVDLTNEEILALSLEAHRRNITLNELMNHALECYVEQHKDLK
jgi:hypothetical protein